MYLLPLILRNEALREVHCWYKRHCSVIKDKTTSKLLETKAVDALFLDGWCSMELKEKLSMYVT